MLHPLADFRWSGVGRSFSVSLPCRLHQTLMATGLLGGDIKDQSTGIRTRRRMVRNLSDPSRGFQSRSGEWAALREWTLSGTAHLNNIDEERIFLCAKAVRGNGILLVDGVEIGPFADGDWEIEITSHTVEKEQVQIELRFSKGLPIGHPPRVGIGVDDGLYIRGISQLRIVDQRLIPRIVDNYGVLESHLTVLPYMPGRYVFNYVAQYGDETLAAEEITERVPAATAHLMHRIVLPMPKRWTPGEENKLILLKVTVQRSGIVCDDRILYTNFLNSEFSESPRQFLLNHAPYFLCGTEWTGCLSSLLSDVEIEQRLLLLRMAGINCLRVYGTETDIFYDALDRLGFLLWQILPSNERDAVAVIRHVRHRPSLIAYSAEFPPPSANPQSFLRPYQLKALIDEHDTVHPFFGQAAIDPVKPGTNGHVIIDFKGPSEYPGPVALCTQANEDTADVRTIAASAPPLQIADLSGGEPYWPPEEPIWLHRADKALSLDALQNWYGVPIEDSYLPIIYLRGAQAEVIRYTVERARIRGSIGVFLQDSFDRLPSFYSTALFDETCARPGFWALQCAMRPIHACAELPSMSFSPGATLKAKIHLLCNTMIMGLLSVQTLLYTQDGQLLNETSVDVKPESGYIDTFTAQLPEEECVLLLRLFVKRFGEVVDQNDYTLCVSNTLTNRPMMMLPQVNVYFLDGALQNDGPCIAPYVSGAAYHDAYFPGWGTLLPGEVRYVLQENMIEGVNLQAMDFS